MQKIIVPLLLLFVIALAIYVPRMKEPSQDEYIEREMMRIYTDSDMLARRIQTIERETRDSILITQRKHTDELLRKAATLRSSRNGRK